MTLVHSTHTWLPLTEQWIYRQVKNITGIEQMVLCDKKDDAFDEIVKTFYNPGSTFDLKNRIRNKLGMPDKFRNEILKNYDDIILFSHYGIQGYQDLSLKKRKHITRFYGYDLTRTIQADKRWKQRYQKLFEECDLFITEGNYMKQLLQDMNCAENKIKVSYLGTMPSSINYIARQESNDFNVLIACATAERKGIIYSLEALASLIHDYKVPVKIHWVGARGSNYIEYINYEKQLFDFINEENLKPYITHYGFVPPDTLQQIAAQCQVALHPSVWAADGDCEGGYPVVLTDLMAGGLPVIATTHCDIPEVVTNSNGYLCEEKNTKALVTALMDCYQTQSYITKSMLARKTIEEKFNWSKLGDELREIILS